jgi:hypothetical protein
MSNFQEFAFARAETTVDQAAYRQERRKRVRTTLHWPIVIFRNRVSDGIESTTHNLSSTGFFCLAHMRLDMGEAVVCTFRVPSHDPEGKERLWILECRARVRRVEPAGHEGLFGLACEFEDYRLLTSHHATAQA